MNSVKITNLELENVKRVRAVAFKPNKKGLTVIGGNNCQGKTSVLDAIAYALGGEKMRPSSLQNREGLAPARMQIELSNGLIVTREGKNAALKVTDPTGKKSGQRLLDSLIEEMALNLPKFMQQTSKTKAETLLQVLGVEKELAELEQEERKFYDERTLANREADRKNKYAAELEEYPEAPEEPLSGAEMSQKLTEALAINAEHQRLRMKLAELESNYALKSERTHMLSEQYKQAMEEQKQAEKELKAAQSVNIEEDVNTEAINEALENIDIINAKVRTNKEKVRALDDAKSAKEEVTALTNKIEEVRERRKALLNSAALPLPELTIENGELVYKGQKWDCMSSMEQMRVSVSICRALKPSCGFVLLDKLEAFDPEQLEEFGKWLIENGMQAIATRVATDGSCDLIIEDGMIKEDGMQPKVENDKGVELGDW